MMEVKQYAERTIEAVRRLLHDLKATSVYSSSIIEALQHSMSYARAYEPMPASRSRTRWLRRCRGCRVEELTELLQGPTAIAYCHGDPVRVAKTLRFHPGEENRHSRRQAGSLFERRRNHPRASREQLFAQIMGHRLAAEQACQRLDRSHERAGCRAGSGSGTEGECCLIAERSVEI